MLMKQQLLGLRSHRTRLWFVVEPPKSHSSTDMFGMFETTRQFCLEGNHMFLDCEAIKTMTNATRMLCQSLSKQAFKHVGIALVHPCPSSSSPQSTQKPYQYNNKNAMFRTAHFCQPQLVRRICPAPTAERFYHGSHTDCLTVYTQ